MIKKILCCISFVLFVITMLMYLKESITVTNSVNGRELPIYSVSVNSPKIAITFDAAWGSEDCERILNILDEQQVRTTFFMTGNWVDDNPELVQKICASGHDIGNHSNSHPTMSKLSEGEIKEELQAVKDKVQALTGYEMFLFRPPYGDYDDHVIKTASSAGYYCIQWSVDSLDWKDYGCEDIIKRVTEHKALKPGAIILCHNGAKYTADALETLLVSLKEKGYEFVPVSELIYKDQYYMLPDGTQVSNQN